MFNSDWYKSLIKPMYAPPEWVFAPAWSILYLLMFVSFALYYFKPAYDKKSGYIFFTLQLLLNLLWSPVFFYYKKMALAFVVVVLLDICVMLMIRKFYEVSKLSAFLSVPYLLWILFATYLNLGYLLLNS